MSTGGGATGGKRPGSPKTGGRLKGTPNKNKAEFLELLNDAAKALGREGFDPLRKLAEIYFTLEDAGVGTIGARTDILVKTLEYSYAKKKAVEVSGPDGGAIEVDFSDAAAKFAELASASDS